MPAKEKARIGVLLTLDGVSLLDEHRTKANDGLGLSRSAFIEVLLRRAEARGGWMSEERDRVRVAKLQLKAAKLAGKHSRIQRKLAKLGGRWRDKEEDSDEAGRRRSSLPQREAGPRLLQKLLDAIQGVPD